MWSWQMNVLIVWCGITCGSCLLGSSLYWIVEAIRLQGCASMMQCMLLLLLLLAWGVSDGDWLPVLAVHIEAWLCNLQVPFFVTKAASLLLAAQQALVEPCAVQCIRDCLLPNASGRALQVLYHQNYPCLL